MAPETEEGTGLASAAESGSESDSESDSAIDLEIGLATDSASAWETQV